MNAQKPSEAKLLRTAVAARELGLQPDQFHRLATQAGLIPRNKGSYHLWSQADVEVVRALLEKREAER